MDTVVLEKLSAGGQMALTEQIDNYPGFEDGIDGFSLGEKMKRGTERFGVETKLTEVLSLELTGSVKKAATSEGPLYAKTIGTAQISGSCNRRPSRTSADHLCFQVVDRHSFSPSFRSCFCFFFAKRKWVSQKKRYP